MAKIDGATAPKPNPEIRCSYCGSKDVTRDAVADFNEQEQEWELCDVLDSADCGRCGGETKLISVRKGERRPRVVIVKRTEVKKTEVVVHATDAELERIARDAADEIDFSDIKPDEFPTLEIKYDT